MAARFRTSATFGVTISPVGFERGRREKWNSPLHLGSLRTGLLPAGGELRFKQITPARKVNRAARAGEGRDLTLAEICRGFPLPAPKSERLNVGPVCVSPGFAQTIP
jgi:hypothetical protein